MILVNLKIDVLKKHIRNRNPNTEVTTLKVALNSSNLEEAISNVDCILFTADTPIGINNVAKEIADRNNKYFLATGYSFNRILFDNVTTRQDNADELQWQSLNSHIMPSSGPINAEASGIACNMILKMIFYKKKNMKIRVNSKDTW